MPYSALRKKQNELIRKARDGSVFLAPYTALAIASLTSGTPANEVQTVTINGTPTGGTWTLTYNAQTTTAIAYNAPAAAVQSALEGLVNIGAGNVSVAGAVSGPYTVTFVGTLASTDVAQMTSASSFTGGTSPSVTVATTTPGAGVDLAPLPTGYEDLGWTSTDGSSFARATDVSNVSSFGSVQPTRADVTKDEVTLQVTAQETKLMVLGLYTGVDTAYLKANAGTGELKIAKPSQPGFKYYRVLGLYVDQSDYGEIYYARYMPRARVTAFGDQAFTDGDTPISYQLTFTGFEDSVLGYSHAWYFGGNGWRAYMTKMGVS